MPHKVGTDEAALWRRLLAEILGSAFLAAVVIGSGIAVAGLFVPGVDIIDVAALTTIGVASRVAQRSINNGTSPLSSKNLGANLLDVFISGVSLGLVGATSSAAEGIFSDMSPASAALLRARLSLPDIIEFIVDNSGGRGH